jgi:transcriptional regulator of arginine metabolism
MSRTYSVVGRTKRLELIRNILSGSPVGSHAVLASMLSNQGVYVTQATLSRDLTQLGAVRTRTIDGLRYVIPDHGLLQIDRDQTARSIHEITEATSILVLHTDSDSARSVADALTVDPAVSSLVAGCVADRDVVLVAARSPHTAADLASVIELRYRKHAEQDD